MSTAAYSGRVIGTRWTVEQVMAAAPDSAAQVAGRRLATPGPWSSVGTAEGLLWGQCQGSGRTPYEVTVDTVGRRYQCSCPSRKFPCKHALGLLFLWAAGAIDESGEITARAAAFAAGARTKSGGSAAAAESTPERTAAQLAAAAERAAERERRVDDGLAELDRWLADQVAAGLARVATDPWAWVEPTAARMVDAQAPAVAAWLRRLPPLVSAGGPEWPARLLDELALMHLLNRGWAGRDDLPPDLVDTVREHIGFQLTKADVLARPAVRDTWTVVALRDLDSETVSTRRVWLHGRDGARWAQVLFFTAGNAAPDTSLIPGTVIDADLHFYPGRAGLRAAVGNVHTDPVPVTGWRPPVDTVDEAAARWTTALAGDPWQRQIAVVLRGRMDPRDQGWVLTDPTGRAVALLGEDLELWRLFAMTAGTVVDVAGEWNPDGFRPAALARDGGITRLGVAW